MRRLKSTLAMALLMAIAMALPARSSLRQQEVKLQPANVLPALHPETDADSFIILADDDKITCREATPEEAQSLNERAQGLELHVIYPDLLERIEPQQEGLHIILRGTQQLEGFPAAKNAFIRAAQTWENLIATPITVIIDVDFGPTRFGNPFPAGVLGSTSTQSIGADQLFPDVRSSLLERAHNPREAQLYGALPQQSTVPTDIGNTSFMVSPSAVFRALGIIDPVANPDMESQLGPPPSIGFNSNFSFDFDPTDGIDPDKFDFDAVATHEIGHALGFASAVGRLELNPSSQLLLTVWDLFRFRPGTTLDTFPTAQRILSSGGEQRFFAGAPELALSTGRPNGTGGDGNQASHWKANELTGLYIGIMDPTIARGERQEITENDLLAIDTFGYQLRSDQNPDIPRINSLSAVLRGDILTLSGSASDPNRDVIQGQVFLFSGSGQTLGNTNPFDLEGAEGQDTFSFQVQVSGLNQFPTAALAGLVLIDRAGNRSARATADFSQPDPGGPIVRSAFYNPPEGPLVIKGDGFPGSQLQIEINGVIVAPPQPIKVKGGGVKLKIPGTAGQLNLRSGPNRVRVIRGGLFSNIFIMTN